MLPHSSFLDLPVEIRERIYTFAGLVRFCPISLNDEGSRKAYQKLSHTYRDENPLATYASASDTRGTQCDYYKMGKYLNTTKTECVCPHLPTQLFIVCRMIHLEAMKVLYSRNKFRLSLQQDICLEEKYAAHMTSLCVRLNMSSYVPNHFCNRLLSAIISERWEACNAMCKRGRDPPLSLFTSYGFDLIRRWTEICKILENSVRPEMRLSVICDCADGETAQKVVAPLQSIRRRIAGCSIRLGELPHMKWQHLAEDTVLIVTDRPPTKPFRFVDLPKELQREILCWTDLVSPYILENYFHISTRHCAFRPFEQHGRTCCLRCTDGMEGCCCPINHSAFTSFRCVCWSLPTALFRVSKGLKDEAIAIFFSKNRFLIHEQPWTPGSRPAMRLALSFFRTLKPPALKNLRWLRFNLIGDGRLDVLEGTTLLERWKEVAQFIAHNLRTSNLTVELDLRYGFEHPDPLDPETEKQRERNWKSYQNMARVFNFKDGLKDFFVHLASPYEQADEIDFDVRKNREKILEKMIMGDDYDAAARGKFTNRGLSLRDVHYQRIYEHIG